MIAVNAGLCLFIGLKNDIWLWEARIEPLGLSSDMDGQLAISEMMKMVEARGESQVVIILLFFSGDEPLLGHSQYYGIILISQLLIGV
jgi:hypothetical protein